MKKLLMIAGVLSATSAFAVPSQFKLFSPTKIVASSDKKELTLTVKLPCTNDTALDWSTPVMGSDDSGDITVAVGLAVSMKQCEKGPLKEFTTTVDSSAYAGSYQDVIEFTPMDLQK